MRRGYIHPRIAIPVDTLTEATNIINERDAAFAPRPLVEAIIKSGGLPVIPPSVAASLAPSYLDPSDGIIFAGGSDVDSTFFNGEPHQKLGPIYLKRGQFEISLATAAFDAGKLMMGICHGMQVLNVALGGILYQDLSENPRQTLKHSQDAPGNSPSHHVNIDKASRLFNLIGPRLYVNSRYHQSLNQTAKPLHVTAWADNQVPEAVETINSDQILVIQWHPENTFKHYDYSRAIFADLITRAKKAAK